LDGFFNDEKNHLYRITKEWNVEEATWLEAKSGEEWDPESDDFLDQGGAYTEDDAAETNYADTEEWEEFDVTEMVKYLIDNPDKNYGFLIISDEEMNNTQRLYVSSDYTDDKTLRPKLTISDESPIIYTPQKASKSTIMLSVTNEAIRFSVPYEYHHAAICDSKGRTVASFHTNSTKRYALPLEGFSNGVHFLTVRHNQGSESIPFIIVK